MAGKVQHKNIESRTARSRRKRGRQPHWQSLVTGKVHLGYQCWKGDKVGRWVLRRYIGNDKYRTETLGRADDVAVADGVTPCRSSRPRPRRAPWWRRRRRAARSPDITVRQAMALYTALRKREGKSVSDVVKRSAVHILPDLGDLVVSELTAKRLRDWLAAMAAAPAQTRPKDGKAQYKAEPVNEEDVRCRRATCQSRPDDAEGRTQSRLRRRARQQSRCVGRQAQAVQERGSSTDTLPDLAEAGG